MNSLVRRVLSLLLCICMTLSVMPVFAVEGEIPSEQQAVNLATMEAQATIYEELLAMQGLE